ncbi:MAG: quinone-dependent dihydroorotate dehydrogenase [Myxococcota bacterium]
MLYRLVRPLFYRFAPETAHHIAMTGLRTLHRMPPLTNLLRRRCLPRSEALEVRALGLTFPTPIGLAAGFDKDAVAFEALGGLGFGHVEVGTLTGEGQPGNPRPRLFRLEGDRALVNRMGFNNHGSAAAVERLRSPRQTCLGVNIGKTKRVAEEDAVADYVRSTERLGAFADYFVVNVSSPNTPGLRDLQAIEKLRPLLEAVRTTLDEVAPGKVPLLVKIAPDLANDDIDAVAALALELNLDGIIATNTTIDRAGLRASPARIEAVGRGGLSGAPLKQRSTAVIRRLYRLVGKKMVLIGVGGIETVDDAWARICAGATLLQLYTAFIYEGPGLPRTLALGLKAKAREAGFARVQDAVGSAQ